MAILKDLIVHGSSRFLNKIYASEIQTPLIEAEAGIFKKLKADDATVVGLLDVQGQLHTNSWSNSNIATIDGSFYITPTLSSSSGTVSFSSATAATFIGTYSAVSSLYIGNDTASTVQWTSGSKILITGEVQVDEEWIPLGTLLGTLNSTNPTTSMPIVNITDNRNNTSNILTNIYSLKSNDSLSYRNLKISLYQRADNSEYYPLGIFMTALGQNGKTFLDIYGGVNALTTSYGGYANPNVRIGNLSGLPAITTAAGNFSPVGWGIYTTNGYFSGTIVSNTGVIGGWKLGANSLYNETSGLNDNTVGIYLGTDGIRNYLTSTQYVNITGGKIIAQGVDLTGEITASSGSIGGWNIGTDTNKSLYYGNQTPGATTTNLILSPTSATNSNAIGGSSTGLTWFISAGKVFGVTTAGALYCNDAHISGEITTTSGTIGGFQIDSSSIHTKNVAITSNADNSIALSSADFTRTINSISRTGLRFAIGDKFGVTGDGTVYASDVDLTGKITATSGTIGGIKIIDGNLDISSISIGMNQVTNLSTALEGKQAAGDYATNTALNNVSTTANTALGQSVWYAECSTTAGTAVKVATISPVTTNFVLTNGITVNVKFINTNSASGSSLQLNVNETGAKNIKYIYNGTYNNIQSNHLKANQMYQFRYDGTYWIVQMMYNTNDFDRSLYEVALQASEAIPSARIAVLGLDEKLHLLNSSSFRISCPLLYVGNAYSADNVTNSFSRATNYTYWGTPFNLTNTHSIQNATANTNVYVVGTLSGDIFTPNTTVLTCAEPITEDGLYYMLLGRMTSTRYAILQAEHPIYIYKNGKFQKLEATTATSYITYIDANNGIKIHNESDTLNYLQLNSTAISIYRNNIETLNINNNEIRIGKFSDNNVCIDNDSVDIRNGQTVLSSFGNNAIIIGQYGKSRLMLSPTMISGISDIGYKNFNIISGDSSEEETTITKNGNFENESSETGAFHGSIRFSERFYYFHKITATVVFNYVWDGEQQTTDPLTLDIDDPEDETGNVWFIDGSVVNSSYVLEYRITCSTQHNGEMTYVYFDTDAQLTPKNTSIPVSYEIESTAPYSIVIETKVYKNTSYTFGSRTRKFEQGNNSFTIGEQLIASSDNQVAIGMLNNDDPNKNYAFMIGNGVYDENHREHRSNAFAVDWNGNTEIAGDLTVTGKLIADRFGGSYLPAGTNIDNLTKDDSGWWAYSRSDAHGTFPITDTYGTIGHIQGTSRNIAMQFLRSNAQGVTNPILYARYKINGTWGTWVRYVDDTTTNLTITRVNNSYMDATSVGYLQARRKGGYLSLRGNFSLSASVPTNTAETVVAQISGWNGVSGYFVAAPQNSTYGNLLICVTADGRFTIANYSGKTCAGWYRFVLTTPCNDGYE